MSDRFGESIMCGIIVQRELRDAPARYVRRSLERDGWTITHDPYPVRLGDFAMGIDLGAEKLIAADSYLQMWTESPAFHAKLMEISEEGT